MEGKREEGETDRQTEIGRGEQNKEKNLETEKRRVAKETGTKDQSVRGKKMRERRKSKNELLKENLFFFYLVALVFLMNTTKTPEIFFPSRVMFLSLINVYKVVKTLGTSPILSPDDVLQLISSQCSSYRPADADIAS